MKFHIIATKSKRPLWAKSAFENYQQRFDQSIQVKWSGMKSNKNSKSLGKEKLMNEGGTKLLNSVNENSIIVSLNKEEIGWSSLKLKQKFDQWLASSQEVFFLIGRSEGLSDKCLDSSNEIWSLSPLTLPHSIVPIILIEQHYRVWTIEKNQPLS
jgi:23S rRNA (pseudouridine1915-N3)-methyltransferase